MEPINSNPIKKVIDGIKINTEIDFHIHTEIKVISEEIENELKYRHIAQGLFHTKEKNQDGHFYLAHWNKMQWNSDLLYYEYVNEASLISAERARGWVLNYDPSSLKTFDSILEEKENSTSTQVVTIRMPTSLKENLSVGEKFGLGSFNKTCLNLIQAGLYYSKYQRLIRRPGFLGPLVLPDGRHATDIHGAPIEFDDPLDRELSSLAAELCTRGRYDKVDFMYFAIKALHKLSVYADKEKNPEKKERINTYLLCFSKWVAQFYSGPRDPSLVKLCLENP